MKRVTFISLVMACVAWVCLPVACERTSPRECLAPDALPTGTRGGMCRVDGDCPRQCGCNAGFCVTLPVRETPTPEFSELPDATEASIQDSTRPEPQNPPEPTIEPRTPPVGHPDAWVMSVGLPDKFEIKRLLPTNDGAILVFGHFQGSLEVCSTQSTKPDSYDLFLWKVTPEGKTLWCHTFGGEGDEKAHTLQQDTQGFVYLLGSTRSKELSLGGTTHKNKGERDILLLKVAGVKGDKESIGDVVWVHFYGTALDDEPGLLLLDNAGHLFVGWNSSGPSNKFGGRTLCSLVKLKRDGNVLISRDPMDVHPQCTLLGGAASPKGGVVLTGRYNHDGPGLVTPRGENMNSIMQSVDLFVMYWTSSDLQAWAFGAGTVHFDHNSRVFVQVASDGSIYWAGEIRPGMMHFTDGTVLHGTSEYNGFLVRLRSDGELLWARRMAGSASAYVFQHALLLRKDPQTKEDYPLLVGRFSHRMSLQGKTHRSLLSEGEFDLFLATATPQGEWSTLRVLGTKGEDTAWDGWCITAKGALYGSGATASSRLSLDGHIVPRTLPGMQGWLWKLSGR